MTDHPNAVEFDRVSIVFGDRPEAALPLMDQGMERGEIRLATGQVLGVHDCSLNVRHGEILVLMAQGRLNKQIAHELSLSEKTVKMHRALLLQRLEVATSADAVRLAVEAGL